MASGSRSGFSCRSWPPLDDLLSFLDIKPFSEVVAFNLLCMRVDLSLLVTSLVSSGDTILFTLVCSSRICASVLSSIVLRVLTALCRLCFHIRCLLRPWMLSEHLNGASGLPCIEVFIRQVLILHIAKGFVPVISVCVYGVVVVKWDARSLFRDEPPHLGTLCQFLFPKSPFVWCGLDDQALSVLQGFSSRLIAFSAIVAEFVIFQVASDAVSHEAFEIVRFRSSLVSFVEMCLKSISCLDFFDVSLSISCFVILYFHVGMVLIPPLLSEMKT
ncbi:unnamed protein product [Cochlearia groenlandica]